MQAFFYQLADAMTGLLTGEEVFTASLHSEDSDFVRFNQGAIRQAGSVTQHDLTMDLISGRRHCAGDLRLTGDLAVDCSRVKRLLGELRERRAHLPEDPHVNYAREVHSSEWIAEAQLPDRSAVIADIEASSQGRDLVGVYAAGAIHTGFANSLGQRNWHSTHNFNLDWSLYLSADRAVKSNYAGLRWDSAAFRHRVELAAERLEVLKRPAKRIEPGSYRVYLTPAALNEVMELLGWGGFGLKSHKTKQTPLLQMIEEGRTLNAALTVREHTTGGIAPNFQEHGFVRPESVTLIDQGVYKDCLVSPRSAKEFGVKSNGAAADESPVSLEIAAGDLDREDVLAELGTGVYVANLWYLNWSDRNACRMTGMTRFATFWVENGEIQAPLEVMRFDETLYRMFGEQLSALTAQREFLLDPTTYLRRSTRSARLPGALIEAFRFTL